jgi:hypothetical protein
VTGGGVTYEPCARPDDALAHERLHSRESIEKDGIQLFASLVITTQADEESRQKGERITAGCAESGPETSIRTNEAC